MSAFPWRIWKSMGCSWLRQGFKRFCKGRALIFFCRLWANLSLLRQNSVFHFFGEIKSAQFSGRKEEDRYETVSNVHFDRAVARIRDWSRRGKTIPNDWARWIDISCKAHPERLLIKVMHGCSQQGVNTMKRWLSDLSTEHGDPCPLLNVCSPSGGW